MRKIENLSPLYRDSVTKAVNLTANSSVRWSAVLLSLLLVSSWAQAVELRELRWFESANGVELRLLFDEEPAPEPVTMLREAPRMVIGFANVTSALNQEQWREASMNAPAEFISGVRFVPGTPASRLEIELTEAFAQVETRQRWQGSVWVLQLQRDASAALPLPEISALSFDRGSNGDGLLSIVLSAELADSPVMTKASRPDASGAIVVELDGVRVADSWLRRYDATAFGTAVSGFDARRTDSGIRLAVTAAPRVDFVAYPRGSTFVLSVSPQLGESIEETREDDAFSQYTEEITGLSFQNVPVRSALYQLASFYDFNLVASDSISGEITIDLDGVPWDQALALVLRLKRLSGRLEGNVLYVAPTEELAAQDQFDIEAAEQAEALAPLATEFLQVNYANADELLLLLVGVGANGQQNLPQVQAGGDRRLNQGLLSPRGSASVDPRTNILIVRDIREKLDEVKALLATLDIAVRQVLIEARIVNVETSIGRELGIRWGFGGRVDNTRIGGSQGTTTSLLNSEAARADARAESFIAGEAARINALLDETPAELIDDLVALAQASVPIPRDVIAFPEALSVDLGVADPEASSFALGYARDSGLIELELSALESSGNGEVIARPKVTTQDKMPALIQSGVRIPYQAQAGGTAGGSITQFEEAVLSLEVTPQITPDGRINMQLDIRQDSVAPGNSLIPAINTNQVTTRALVNDGETIVLGGVFREETSVTESKTPILGDLPYVGRLFKRSNRSNRRTELLIFITPKILDELPR